MIQGKPVLPLTVAACGYIAASVLRLRFGLDGNEPHTLKEAGRTLGLTRERIRQIEQQALSRLRSMFDPSSRRQAS